MLTVGQIVRQRREAMGLTLEALAREIDATKSYLSMIENHRVENPPSAQLLSKLERALGISDGELCRAADWQSTPAPVRQQFQQVADEARQGRELARWLKDVTRQRIDGARSLDEVYRSGQLGRRLSPLLGEADAAGKSRGKGRSKGDAGVDAFVPVRYQVPLINRVSAGYPRDFTDLDYPRRVADEFVSAPGLTDPDAFAARVVGDSMLPEYREGDIVTFSPAAKVVDGCDCFVRLEPDHESTFKRIFFEKGDDDSVRLQPLNAKYPPRVVPRDVVAGLYRAVAKITALL